MFNRSKKCPIYDKHGPLFVDNINRLVSCSLVIRYGINNIHTWEASIGFAILGRQYHGRDIPKEYYRVKVLIVIQGYEDDMLDIPSPRGLRNLDRLSKISSFSLDGTSN